jgi:hypothetical protein
LQDKLLLLNQTLHQTMEILSKRRVRREKVVRCVHIRLTRPCYPMTWSWELGPLEYQALLSVDRGALAVVPAGETVTSMGYRMREFKRTSTVKCSICPRKVSISSQRVMLARSPASPTSTELPIMSCTDSVNFFRHVGQSPCLVDVSCSQGPRSVIAQIVDRTSLFDKSCDNGG